jgi:hypothetical protein
MDASSAFRVALGLGHVCVIVFALTCQLNQLRQYHVFTLQDVAGIVRYMTHANRRDFLDAHWTLVAQDKTFGLVQMLLSRKKANKKLLKKLKAEVASLERRAGGRAAAEQKATMFRDRIEGRLRPDDKDDLKVSNAVTLRRCHSLK